MGGVIAILYDKRRWDEIARKVKDLTGQKFGRWTVLSRAGNRVNQKSVTVMWNCKCDCGTEKPVSGNSLISGKSKSCGCLNKEIISDLNFGVTVNMNIFDLSKDVGIGYTVQGEEFLFDSKDYDLIKDYYWRVNDGGYITTVTWSRGFALRLSRLIMHCPKGKYVDHINHDKMDNRKENLRIVTPQQNAMNQSLKSNNKSGVQGVCYDKSRDKWMATITYKYKTINLGRFDDFNDAVSIRKDAEEKYFGKYSYDNSVNIKQ